MDADYARQYEQLYRRHWWWRAREALVLDVLRDAKFPRGGGVLDVGCGNGLFFETLSEFGSVEGVEADAALVPPDAPHRDRIYVGPFDRAFGPEQRYALIVMLDVLEHMADPQAALDYATELLEDDGALLITVPAFRALWTAHDDLNRHYTRYTKSSLARLTDAAGLRTERQRYFFHWLVIPKLLVRGKEKLFGARPGTPQIPPAFINRSVYALSRCEQKLTGLVPLPVGSSLMVLARKKA